MSANTAKGSTLAAGGNVSIKATGGGEASDILIQGSKIDAAKNVTLKADDDINLLAARNDSETHSTNKSSSASVGVSVGAVTGITVSANRASGRGDGAETYYTNTQIKAGNNTGNTLTLESGGDTTLKGAVAQGNKVVADVKGKLLIESLQDKSTYKEQQRSSGASITISPAGIPTGGSVSAGRTNINSNFESVTEQSGIKAGDGGFEVNVEGNTTLNGGAITSSQKAIDDKANSFETKGQLAMLDIKNQASYEARSAGGTMGVGSQLSSSGAGAGQASGNAASTTTSGISGVAGDQTKRTGDLEQGIKPIFDKEAVKLDVEAQVQITTLFGQQASKTVGDYGTEKLKEAQKLKEEAAKETDPDKRQALEKEAQDIEQNWKEGGLLRVALHSIVGGLTGGLGGLLGAATTQTLIPMLGEQIANLNVPKAVKEALLQAAALAVGGATGGAGGAAAGLNATGQNYLSHVESEKLQALRTKKLRGECNTACENEIKRLETLDKERDIKLAACSGSNTTECQQTRQEVRQFAAEYVREGLENAVLGDAAKTLVLARNTMNGQLAGNAAAVLEAAKETAELIATAISATWSDEARQELKDIGQGVADALKDPSLWPYLMGQMTPQEREQLAKAYETGDGYTVGKIMAGQALGILGPTKLGKLDKAADIAKEVKRAAVAKEAEKVAERVKDVKTIIKPEVGSFKGATSETINTINDVIGDGVNSTIGGSVRNIDKPPGSSIEADFEKLVQGGAVEVKPNGTKIGTAPDGTKFVIYPSTSRDVSCPVHMVSERIFPC